MVKKVFAWIGVVILSFAALWVATLIFAPIFMIERTDEREREFIPIEEITGIYTEATLKPGCYVDSGTYIPFSDDGAWCAVTIVTGLLDDDGSGTVTGIPVKKLWIVDVYGDYCTIVFECSDGMRYSHTGYPLANLNYDSRKVERANDGVQTQLRGSGYILSESVRKSGGNSFNSLFISVVIVVFGMILLVRNVIRSRKEGLPEKTHFEERACSEGEDDEG